MICLTSSIVLKYRLIKKRNELLAHPVYVDIFILVFYLPYYCNIRYVVLSFDEINTHY